MPTLAEEQEYVKALYWGAYGSGKTTDAAYLAHSGVVKWIRADKGLKARPLRQLGVPVERIEPIDELNPDVLARAVEKWRGQLHDTPGCIAGVVIDTATELIARRVEHYTDQAWEAYKAKSRKQHTEIDHSQRFSSADNYELYQPVTQEVGRLVRHIVDLPCHAAFLTQTRRDVDKDTCHTQYGPAANPAVQGALIGYCDIVIETQLDGQYEDGDEEDAFVGYPRPRFGREGKDRFHALPRILVTPTMDRVIAYVRGELDYKTDPVQLRYRETLKIRQAQEKREADEL